MKLNKNLNLKLLLFLTWLATKYLIEQVLQFKVMRNVWEKIDETGA